MKDFNWESPAKMGNPLFMGACWGMAIQKTIIEDNLKKYFPIQYQMMETLKKLQQG